MLTLPKLRGGAMAKFRSVRWTMITLFVGAMVLNYLSRSILGVAAPTIMAEQHISTAQYSWITGAFQITIMLQPVSGFVLDLIGLKVGFALFAGAWSLLTMAHVLATGWPTFAGLRGMLGFVEGAAQPARARVPQAARPPRLVGDRVGAFPCRPGMGHAVAVDAALPDQRAAFRHRPHRAFRLASISRCRPRLPVRARGRSMGAPARHA